jgi:hypothetical protein
MLGHADLTLELLSLRLRGDGHAAPKNNIDLPHLLISVRICLILINSPGLLQCRCYWGWHLLLIQETFALFQIMPHGVVNLTPLLCVIGTPKRALLFLLRGLLAMISMAPLILAIAPISYVELTIFLLPRGPLAPGF